MNLFLNRQKVDECSVNPRVRIVALCRQKTAESVLHRPCRGRVDMALDGGKVDDVLTEEVVRHLNAVGENAVKNVGLRLGAVLDPFHVRLFEIVEDRHRVLPKERHVVVQVLSLEGIRDHGLVLHAHDVGEARLLEGEDAPSICQGVVLALGNG